jgi:hypothetical protein
MADNTTINPGSGGDTLRTDDVGGGVKVPVSKIITGGDGIDGGFVGMSNPFPIMIVSGSDVVGTVTNPLRVSGSIGVLVGGVQAAASNPLPVIHSSGSQTGLLVGSNPVNYSNPLPVIHSSGSQTGLLIGSNPVNYSNPLPVTGAIGVLVAGSQASRTNPLPVYCMAEPAGQIMSGSTVVPVYHAFGDFGTSGSANQVIPPQGAGKRIAVLSAHLMAPSTVFVRWQSTGSAGTITNISGLMPVPANGGFVLPHNPHGWFKTLANEGLNLNLNSAVSCGVIVTWTVFNNP